VVRVPNQALHFRPTAEMYRWLGLTPPAGGQSLRIAQPEFVSSEDGDVEADGSSDADASKIDELFAQAPRRVMPGQVWVYDEEAVEPERRLRQIPVRTGIVDEQFSELVSGDLKPGVTVLTGITPPPSVLAKASGAGGIFQQPNRGFGGMTPAGPTAPPTLAPPGRGGFGRGGD